MADELPNLGNDMHKEQLRDVLDGVAQKCKDQGHPLLNALVRNPDGSFDLDDFRRWYKIRYDMDLPKDTPFADQVVIQIAEAEAERVYEWQKRTGRS